MTTTQFSQKEEGPKEERAELSSEGAPDGLVGSVPVDELERLRAELADAVEQKLRAVAEVDNIRKRTHKEGMEARLYAVSSFARDLIVILNDLHRCVQSSFENQEGIRIIIRAFEATLERHGVKKFDPQVGDKFNPELHEALFQSKEPGCAPGTISQVMEPGYMINNRLLQAARVGVSI